MWPFTRKKKTLWQRLRAPLFIVLGIILFIAGGMFAWASTMTLPDISTFNERRVAKSTKIFDRTGETILYDVHGNIKRTVIPAQEMGAAIKNATVAIEDNEFYEHQGIQIPAIVRATLINLRSGSFSQGGSTITQQVIKNTLLTQEKRIERKIKEWVLALKLENRLTKDEILGVYLNETPYGGNIYGIAEAADYFFSKEPHELSIAEAAYLSAIPKAPTYYSPYGNNRDALDQRKDTVLRRMYQLDFISQEEYEQAQEEEVYFEPQKDVTIRAPHFVFYVLEQLEEEYGKEMVLSGGLRVRTTLDYDMQQKAQTVVREHAERNAEQWDAENAGLVVMNPNTGGILTMVGSRNYFDEEIDGEFNITTAERQPGSSFKPFAYATAFKKGYTEDTIVFDVPTQFSNTCDPLDFTNEDECYAPRNYDNAFNGPVTFREGLAQSRNVPSVKVLYLADIADTISTARDMGISTLTNANRYGLTLVLGGGEVRLLDMVTAYGTFATDGVKHDRHSITRITNSDEETLFSHSQSRTRVLDTTIARRINDILSDNEARTPLVGSRSFFYHDGYDVAGKTGTTNKNLDAWTIGYTPEVAVGVWVGNNENTPMKRGSGMAGELWGAFMSEIIDQYPQTSFQNPTPVDTDKPVLNGVWQGGDTVTIDTISGKRATEYTPDETKEVRTITNVHSILHWVDPDDPQGPAPEDPENDNQYDNWEPSVQSWWEEHQGEYEIISPADVPEETDDVHTPETQPTITITSPEESDEFDDHETVTVSIDHESTYPLKQMNIFLNDSYVGTSVNSPWTYTLDLSDHAVVDGTNTLTVVVQDDVYNETQASTEIEIDE